MAPLHPEGTFQNMLNRLRISESSKERCKRPGAESHSSLLSRCCRASPWLGPRIMASDTNITATFVQLIPEQLVVCQLRGRRWDGFFTDSMESDPTTAR